MKRVGVLTSGGDAPGMNAAIRAVVRSAINKGMEVVGIERGYEGLIDEDFIPLTKSSVGDILHRGGTMLKTARSERFLSFFGQDEAIKNIKKYTLDALVTIGGDGTFRGAADLWRSGIPVIGIPCTIDNDMGFTDYTIGFDTAVNTVLDAISKIRDTASAHDRTTVIEVMGRHCGDIASYAGVTGGAEYILIPEIETDVDQLCAKIKEGKARGKSHSIILKAEGVDISTEQLTKLIEEKTGLESRMVVLGYLQRGGSPTAHDRMLASLMGSYAVDLIYNDIGGRAIGSVRNEIIDMPIEETIDISREADLEMLELIDALSK